MKLDYTLWATRALLIYAAFWCVVFVQMALGIDVFPEGLEGFVGAGAACLTVIVLTLYVIALITELGAIGKALRRIADGSP